MLFDLVIIGAGPAGLSAAIHAKRFGLDFVVIEKNRPGGQALAANFVSNYPGFPDGISGKRLMGLFVDQAKSSGVKIETGEASFISLQTITKKFKVEIAGPSKKTIESGAVIIAGGLEPIKIPRIDAHYYPVPDDIPHEGKDILVIGGGDSAFDEAISFSKKAKSVTIAMRGQKPKAWAGLIKRTKEAGVKIMTGLSESEILKIGADIRVACLGKRPNLSFLDKTLQVTNRNRHLQFAGDILHPDIRHIAVAAGDGVRAVEILLKSP